MTKTIANTEQALNTARVDDARITAIRPLDPPAKVLEQLQASPAVQDVVTCGRAAVSDIIHERDDRLLVVVGPCSIHRHDEALEYAELLAAQAGRLADELLLVMRVYFEKPRTTVGWKGYINDPDLDDSWAINKGLFKARQILLEVLGQGLPVATEFLDLLSPQFISDLVVWGAIGARTTESPSHRQLASGLSCPIGFKNGTSGDVKVAVDALLAAAAQHAFLGLSKSGQAAIFETGGNPDCHVILRGGKGGPNYADADVGAAVGLLAAAGLPQRLMIDCSHANSRKQYARQVEVAADIALRVGGGDQRLMGVMLESHLHEGRQDMVPGQALQPGVSVTDACLGFEQTIPVLEQLAQAVRSRRSNIGKTPSRVHLHA